MEPSQQRPLLKVLGREEYFGQLVKRQVFSKDIELHARFFLFSFSMVKFPSKSIHSIAVVVSA